MGADLRSPGWSGASGADMQKCLHPAYGLQRESRSAGDDSVLQRTVCGVAFGRDAATCDD